MQTDNDGKLEWPMRATISLTLMNPEINGTDKSLCKTYDTVVDASGRPTRGASQYQGIHDFCILGRLKTHFIHNDVIVIICKVM